MNKRLVAYFSASGVTAAAAKTLAVAAGADLFEIEPEVPYTAADLDWRNKKSRSSLEMKDPTSRPAIGSHVASMDDYNVVFIGFPIWWYREPAIIDTFLEEYDFSGKTIVLFATSGGSGFGKTADGLRDKVSADTKLIEGKLLNGAVTEDSVSSWLSSLEL